MLTRLKVSGFKNLIDVDVRFGPFTCIAGANGVGKSNLFDAIQFLSALADLPLAEAAQSIRAGEGRPGDVEGLFSRTGGESVDEMSFDVEMIISGTGTGDLGQEVRAEATLLRYGLTLGKRLVSTGEGGPLEVLREELVSLPEGAAGESLLFFPASDGWRASVLSRADERLTFIDTYGPNRLIRLYEKNESKATFQANRLPRTVLSNINALGIPTAFLARREMQSWRVLQLDPAAIREPDELNASARIAANGAHAAASLHDLATSGRRADQAYGQVANRLAELIHEIRRVWVDVDKNRQLLTLMVEGRDGTPLPARALSDGTLRFLALAVLELDPRVQGVLCFEEPENGIHPQRIPAMLRLLQDIAVDVSMPVDVENPLRQVIINTHSPAVVAQVPEDSLLIAEPYEKLVGGHRFRRVRFNALPDAWRAAAGGPTTARGNLLSYLSPFAKDDPHAEPRRVVDREDFKRLLSL
jgi:predicted ATPase